MKRMVSFVLFFILLVSCTMTNVSATEVENTDTEKTMDMKIEDPFSEAVLKNASFDERKVQKCMNLSDGTDATGLLIKNNSVKMNNSENDLFVDNCVMVKSTQEIAFNTGKVIAAVHYIDIYDDDVYYIQYETVEAAQEAVELLEQYPTVVYAVTDEIVSQEAMPLTKVEAASPLRGKDGYTHHSWGITQSGLDIFAEYVSNNATGTVDIAVIDSGVHASHSFLQGHISSTQYDLVGQDGVANDPYGHGTFVAGIIVDAMQKLNFNIIPVRVLDANGSSPVSRVAQGIDRAVEAGADVINLSLGAETKEGNNHTPIDMAVGSAISNNIVVVAAAGNQSQSTVERCPAHLGGPIVVSGIDKNGQRYTGSNFGDTVDVTAPGVAVKSCAIPSLSSTGYGTSTGTSFAAPHVAAAAAMLRLRYPSYSPEAIHYQITAYTDDVGSVGTDQYFGTGLLKISNKIIAIPFTDVSRTDYYYDGVYSGYGRGYILGLTNTTFVPNRNMERQDVAVVFYRMAGSPYVTYRQIYPDVSGSDYYAKAVVWAHDNGILRGLSNGNLGVGQPITREDFAVILYRYANYRGMDTSASASLSTYEDGHLVNDYAEQAVKWAVAKGIMGKGGVYLGPQDNIIRADIAVMIYRFLSL